MRLRVRRPERRRKCLAGCPLSSAASAGTTAPGENAFYKCSGVADAATGCITCGAASNAGGAGPNRWIQRHPSKCARGRASGPPLTNTARRSPPKSETSPSRQEQSGKAGGACSSQAPSPGNSSGWGIAAPTKRKRPPRRPELRKPEGLPPGAVCGIAAAAADPRRTPQSAWRNAEWGRPTVTLWRFR